MKSLKSTLCGFGVFFLSLILSINRGLAETIQMKIKLLISAQSNVIKISTKAPAYESQ